MSLLGDLAVVERGEQFKLPQLHMREPGLNHVPAVPVDLAPLPDTLIELGLPEKQCAQTYLSLSRNLAGGIRMFLSDRSTRARTLEAWREAARLVSARWEGFREADAETRSWAYASYVAALDAEQAAAAQMAGLVSRRTA